MLLHEVNDSFLEEVVDFKKARYVILPVPMDITTTYLKGTKFGPRSIIEASRSLENYNFELDYEVKDIVFTANELELPPEPNECMGIIHQTVSDLLMDDKIPILLGGEHTITYGASLAFDRDVVFVIFDAHADMKRHVKGSELNHASNSRLINKRNPVVLIGVRSLSLEDKKDLEDAGLRCIYQDIVDKDDSLSELVSSIRGKKVYLSIDMDVFDPSIAPGVGTPQPGGMTYHQVLRYIREILSSSKLAGFDISETRPIADNNTTEILASKLVIDIVSLNEMSHKI